MTATFHLRSQRGELDLTPAGNRMKTVATHCEGGSRSVDHIKLVNIRGQSDSLEMLAGRQAKSGRTILPRSSAVPGSTTHAGSSSLDAK